MKKYEVSVHAWVFMMNHVHLLCTPNNTMGIYKMMESLSRLYVRYFNYIRLSTRKEMAVG
ncbi:MAG: transposase [Alphaproteobacteria bacterium]|nr:transposase [Alphaproteobacteria bacterium]